MNTSLPRCWRCIAIAALSLPPIIAYTIYKRYKEEAGFKEALESLHTTLGQLEKRLTDELRKTLSRPQLLQNFTGGRHVGRASSSDG
jgi:hypothetical protein